MYYIDIDKGIKHIRPDSNDVTLCGIMRGWTTGYKQKPVKEKWGSNCGGCQIVLEELRTIKK